MFSLEKNTLNDFSPWLLSLNVNFDLILQALFFLIASNSNSYNWLVFYCDNSENRHEVQDFVSLIEFYCFF